MPPKNPAHSLRGTVPDAGEGTATAVPEAASCFSASFPRKRRTSGLRYPGSGGRRGDGADRHPSVLAIAYSLFSDGGCSSIRMPSVCSTMRVFSSWQVGLPRSMSIIKRRPVPDVRARFACVTPRLFRVRLASSPISFAVYLVAMFYSRTVIFFVSGPEIKAFVTEREHLAKIDAAPCHIFPSGNIGQRFRKSALQKPLLPKEMRSSIGKQILTVAAT